MLLTVTWVIGFAIPVAPVSLLLIIGGAFFASIGSGGLIPVVAACSPPRIRSQSFAAFGLSLAVFGAAAAPVVVGGMSELFQQQLDVNEGDSLRYAIIIATGTVSSLGAWFIYEASRQRRRRRAARRSASSSPSARPGGPDRGLHRTGQQATPLAPCNAHNPDSLLQSPP